MRSADASKCVRWEGNQIALQLPKTQGPSVDPSIAPTVRVRPSMDASSFGGGRGVDQAAGVARGLTGDLQDIAMREEMRAQEAQANEIDVELGKLELQSREQLYSVQGGGALEAQVKMLEDYDKASGEILKRATSARVRERVGSAAERRRIALEGTTNGYVRGQMLQHEEEKAFSRVKIEGDNAVQAYQDPVRVQMALDEQERTLSNYAKASGKPREWAIESVKNAHSGTIRGVITRHLEARNYGSAKEQFDLANKAEALNERDRHALAGMVERGSTLGEAQQAVDGFMEKADSLKSLMAMARGIKDEATRAQAEQYAKVRWAERQHEIKEAQDLAVTNAFTRLDADDRKAGSAYELIGPTIYEQLDASGRKLVEKEFKIKRGLEARETDQEVYYALKTEGANEDTRAEFLARNLLEYRHKMTPQDFQELTTFQTGLIKNDSKAKTEAEGYLSKEQTINQMADSIPDKVKRLEFKRFIDKQIGIWQSSQTDKTKLPTKTDIDKMMSEVVKDRTGYWGLGKTVKTFEAPTVQQQDEAIERTRAAAQQIMESDPVEFEKITNAIKRAKLEVTPDRIIDLYDKGRGR